MSDSDVLKIAYIPRKAFMGFHQRRTRFACMVCHRRAGKTVASINEIVHRAIYCKKKRPRYAYLAPLLKQGKKIAWEYLKEYTNGLEKKKPSESELTIVLRHNDSEIGIYGADNPDAIRGQYFDGVVLDEYGDMSPSVWGKVVFPTLSDRNGWAVFIGTFKGKNHFYRIFRRSQGLDLPEGSDPVVWKARWYNLLLKASESGILPAEQLEIARGEMEDEEYRQEYECDPNAVVKGTYYARIIAQLEAKKQIYADIDLERDQPVDVYFDLGYGDSTAAWFIQPRFDGFAVLDYLEDHGKPLDFYFEELDKRGYRYGTIWLPHDAKAHTLAAKRTIVQQFLDNGYPIRIGPKLAVDDGIAAVRKILPKCHFHSRCEEGVEALRAYKRDYDDEKDVYRDTPTHDWSSHGSDAFRYFAVVGSDIITSDSSDKKIVVATPQMCLEELFQFREAQLRRMRFSR